MAQYFSIANGNLGEINAFGVSLSTAEVTNGTTVVPLLTSSLFSTPVFIGKNIIPSVSINLSSVNINSTGNLNLNLKHIQNYNTIIDNSKSNSIIISPTNGGDKVTFSPFSLNGWSALFFPYFDSVDSNRNTTYISLPNPTTNLILDANFTIETWVYFLSAGNALQTIIQSNWSTGNNLALRFNDSTTLNKITFWASNNSSTVPFLTSNSNIDPFKWYHVAVTRNSNTFTLYINGSAEDTKTQAVTISRQLEFIGSTHTPNSYLSGYMSNLRVVKGQSLFTGNFTPPISALALSSVGSTGNVVPLLTGTISLQTFQNNRFIDNSPSNLTLTNSLVRIKNINPFNILSYDKNKNIGSIFLNTAISNDSLYITHNDNLNFVGLTALTIEGWIYFTGKPNNACLWKKGTIDCFLQTGQAIMTTNGSGTVFFNQSTGFNLGEWNHYAMVLSGVNITTYINGKNAGTSSGISINNTGTGNIIIGGNRLPNNSSVFTDGYFSNFRITKSIVYTNAFSLTSSQFLEPLTELPETCLLLNFNNFSDNNIETYPISSFTKFNGNNNTYSTYSQNWQTLKLTNQLSSYDNLMLDLKTNNNNNDIILLGNSTNELIDYTGYFPTISARSTISLSSVNLPNTTTENAIFFDGTNNWLTIPASRNLVFARDFTIEFWINTSTFSIDTTYRRVLSFGINASNNLQLIFSNAAGSSPANTLMVFTNSVIISGTSVVADGNWHHVALSRENNHLKLFVDGIQSGNSYIAPLITGEFVTAMYNAGSINALSIGTSGNTATGRLSGYIANLHIVRDKALYTTNFIASAQSLTATDNSILLLKTTTNYNKVIIGSVPVLSGSLTNIRNVSASSINSPFGSTLNGSLSFSGGNSLSGTADTNFGISDFTVEGWFNARSLKETAIIQTSDSNTGLKTTYTTGIWIRLAASTFYIEANIGNTSINSTFAPTINTWYHFALTRQNGFARLFLNGQLLQSGAATAAINGTFFTIGNYYSVSTYHWPGWLSNIRIIKGQSLYNKNFSVPTSPLSLTHHGTVLLMNSPHSLSSFSYNLSGSGLLFTDVNIGGALSGSNTEVHTISAVTYTLSSIKIHNKGVLEFPYNSSTVLTLIGNAGVQITSDGTMNVGTSSLPISSTDSHILSSNNTNIGIHVHNGGNLNIYGAYKVPYSHLEIEAVPITGRFVANQTLSTTWLSGDNIVFTCNLSGLSTYDTLPLTAFDDAKSFRTRGNSVYRHTALSTNSYIPSISNITRNVSVNNFIKSVGNVNVNINNASFNNLQNVSAFKDNLTGFIRLNNNVFDNYSIRTPFLSCNNIVFNNNIFFRNSTRLAFNNLIGSNINITDNMFLNNINSSNIGLQLTGISANNLTMSGNYVVGLNDIGTYIQNCTATGTGGIGGTINFNGTTGVVISSNNSGNIINIASVYSRNNGIVIWSTNTIFTNITSDNNNIDGIVLSGNNLNYLTPNVVNLNNIQANNNKDSGIEVYNIIGNLNNLTLNDNLSYGLKTSIGNGPIIINNVTSKMISGSNIAFLSAFNYDETIIANSYLSAVTNYANISSNGSILLDSSKLELLTLNNVELKRITTLSSRNVVTSDYNLNNSIIGDSNITVLTATNYNTINVMKGEQTINNHYRLTPFGKISYDNLVYKTNAPSEKLEPNGTLRSSPKLIPCNQNDFVSISAYIKKSINYTGTAPKLMLKRNASIGYDDMVLATSISANNTWELLTGITPIAINSGIFEVYIECTGFYGSGSINIDEWDFS